MAGKPSANCVSLNGSLVKNLQASVLGAVRKMIAMEDISRDSGRANADEGNVRRTKCSSRSGLRGSQVVYAAIWLLQS